MLKLLAYDNFFTMAFFCISAIYPRKLKSKLGHLPKLYFLILWKNYLEIKSIWEPATIVHYFKNTISLFPKNYPNKLISTFLAINITLPKAKPIIKPIDIMLKQKRSQLTKNKANK